MGRGAAYKGVKSARAYPAFRGQRATREGGAPLLSLQVGADLLPSTRPASVTTHSVKESFLLSGAADGGLGVNAAFGSGRRLTAGAVKLLDGVAGGVAVSLWAALEHRGQESNLHLSLIRAKWYRYTTPVDAGRWFFRRARLGADECGKVYLPDSFSTMARKVAIGYSRLFPPATVRPTTLYFLRSWPTV